MTRFNLPMVWPITGGYQLLELPSGFTPDNQADIIASSYDGSALIGTYFTDNTYPCRWDNTVLTTLTGPDVTPGATTFAISQDGTIVLGMSNDSQIIRWTTPTNGTILPPVTGGFLQGIAVPNRGVISDDGSVVVGTSIEISTNNGINTVWTNGTPVSWGYTADVASAMMFVSGNGLTIVGSSGVSRFTGLARSLGFWRSHTFYPLFIYDDIGIVSSVNVAGTIIYGSTADSYGVQNPCYWDNLTSATGTYNFGSGTVNTYGSLHFLSAPVYASFPTDLCTGNAKTANVIVGEAHDSTGFSFAIKWVNGVYANLQPDPIITEYSGRANDTNGDGSIVVGDIQHKEELATTNRHACYWGTDNIHHYLPFTNFPTHDSSASGISRNGALIYGYTNVDTTVYWYLGGSAVGAVGDFWTDPSYVDFSDPVIRSGFINPDGSWLSLGVNGELPTGTSPMDFLTSQSSDDPGTFELGYGQNGSQDSWEDGSQGIDPATGLPYAGLSFDDCGPPTIITPTILSLDNLNVTARFHDIHQVFLRNSNDSGASWGNAVGQSLGDIGEFDTSIQWRRVSYARDRIFEISWSSPVLTSLVGVFVDFQSESS